MQSPHSGHLRVSTFILLSAFFVALASISLASRAQTNDVECLGNTETFDRRVLKPGVKYLMSYVIQGKAGTVKIAGREYTVAVDRGSSWKGPWLKFSNATDYLSFLPEDGGTIKLQLDHHVWFSGNCR
jgi:hypothetical protein